MEDDARGRIDQSYPLVPEGDPLRVFRDAVLAWDGERSEPNEQHMEAARAALDEDLAAVARNYIASLSPYRQNRWDDACYLADEARANFVSAAREVLDTSAPY
ncbi:hypothetical protein [Streptomyces chartreusis]